MEYSIIDPSEYAHYAGLIGVALLLTAYLLNLREFIFKDGLAYPLLNAVGSSLACFASILLNYLPLIILEGLWTVVSLYEVFKYCKEKITENEW